MIKSLLIYMCCVLALCACEQQKQASAEVGAIPKTMIDKANASADAAEAAAAASAKAVENIDVPANAEKTEEAGK